MRERPGTAKERKTFMTAILLEETNRRALLRQQLLAARRAMAQEVWQARNAALVAALGKWFAAWRGQIPAGVAPWIGLYWPMKNEPDVRPLFADWPNRALPAAVAPHTPLSFRPWRADGAMTEDCYGIPTPATAEVVQPQLVIVPLLGFTRTGFRLGYGGGFYDRTLSLWRSQGWRGTTVGVGFADAEVADFTPAPHDVPLDVVVTELGVYSGQG